MTKRLLMLMMVGVWSGCGKEIEVVKEEEGDIEYEVYRDETNNKPTKHGYYKVYHPNKSYKVVGKFKDGKQDGKWVSYNETGQIILESNYKDGKLEGKVVGYYENGQVKEEGNYKDGEKDGKWSWYYESGKVNVEENFVDGKKEGKWFCITRVGK